MNNSTKSGIMSNTNKSKQINELFDLDLKSHSKTKQYSTFFDFKMVFSLYAKRTPNILE